MYCFQNLSPHILLLSPVFKKLEAGALEGPWEEGAQLAVEP